MTDKQPTSMRQAMIALAGRFATANESLPWMDYDPDWISVCQQVDSLVDDKIQWRPELNDKPNDFSNVEYALDCKLHPSIGEYYGCFWSADIEAKHPKGPLTLLQVFNAEDLETLQQNIIGHIMMKQRLKQSLTVFFAVTDEDDQMISVLNETGEVWLEYVGKEPHLKLADSIAQFIALLEF